MRGRTFPVSGNLRVLLAIGSFVLLPALTPAQVSTAAEDAASAARSAPQTFGTAGEVAHVVYGFEFQIVDGAGFGSNLGERLCSTPCILYAPLRLPAGALVSRIELEACDSSSQQQGRFALHRRVSPMETVTSLTSYGFTGLAQTPGCDFFNRPLLAPETINNENNVYFLEVQANSLIPFMAVRVYYRLQVSPAPAVATFPNDVPTTHPFFRFVEALAASGVTAGCGPGSFCPNNPVTRGEMAVFLAAALGLHFVP